MELSELIYLQISGDISVEPVTTRIRRKSELYLLLGPTGAGKSSFIEALAGKSQELSISKDQLAGFTQNVNAYRLVNVIPTSSTFYAASTRGPVYLIDTPGFSDSKISELEIMNMVRRWLKKNDLDYVNGILFLTPITETRLPGSRRKTIEMLKQLLAPNRDLTAVTFVTTMWDTLHNERTRNRAESNFGELRDGICKDFFGEHRVHITQFMNTKRSALEALDLRRGFSNAFSQSETSAFPNLYQDLYARIKGALQEKQIIANDLTQPEARTNIELRAILEKNQRENHETLTKFITQMVNFGSIPKGFEEAHQCLQASIEAMQCAPPPTSLRSPTIATDESTRMLTLKGLIRRSVQAAKNCGKRSFTKYKE